MRKTTTKIFFFIIVLAYETSCFECTIIQKQQKVQTVFMHTHQTRQINSFLERTIQKQITTYIMQMK